MEVLEFGGERDHVHILFETPPQVQLSKLVNTLKTVSSRLIKKQYEQYLKKYYWKSTFWSRSYCIVSTGGATIEIIKKILKIKVNSQIISTQCIAWMEFSWQF
jgi:putative transposase